MLKLLIPSTLIALFFVALGSGTAAAQGAVQVTGCLTAKGTIKNLAIGDAPTKPCKGSEMQVSLPLGPHTDLTSPRTIFVTFDVIDGGDFGLAFANDFCQDAADNAVPPLEGTFIAWLGVDAMHAKDRLPPFLGPYVLPNGEMVVAHGVADLLDTDIFRPINVDEDGALLTGDTFVWTGTDELGRDAPNCTDWTTTVGSGTIGNWSERGDRWTFDDASFPCNGSAHVYCVQVS